MSTNITPAHRDAFAALTSGHYDNFALFSCFVNSEPAAALVAVTDEDEAYTITPLFVSLTPAMTLTDHEGQEPVSAPQASCQTRGNGPHPPESQAAVRLLRRQALDRAYSQTLAAIAAAMHTHDLYGTFYETFGPRLQGCLGLYNLCIAMAEALTDGEQDQGGTWAYDRHALSWIEVVERYVDAMLAQALALQTIPDVRTILSQCGL